MTEPLLKCRDIQKRFGDREVLKGIDLDIQRGMHIGLVGNNGEGKTTLLRILLGMMKPDGGDIFLKGRPLGQRRSKAEKLVFGYLPESVRFYPNLTGLGTLRFLARLKGAAPESCRDLLELVGLSEVADARVKTYSKGMCQRLGLAQALMGEPELLFLDEPTNGLDPFGIREFYTILERLQERNVAILTASHMLAEIEPRLDQLVLLKDGLFQVSGSLASLLEEARLPARIKCVFKNTSPAISSLLEGLGATSSPNGHVHSYVIHCPEHEKGAVLSQLLAHQDNILSFSVKEPGLEEVFHHYQEQGATSSGRIRSENRKDKGEAL